MKIPKYIFLFVLIAAFGAMYAGATGCSVGVEPADVDIGDGGGGDGGGGGGGDDGGGTISAAKSLEVDATPGSGEVVLNWAADPDATTYDVYILPIDDSDAASIAAITEIYNASSGEFDLEAMFSDIDMTIENVTDVTYTHTGATNGQAYCYVVTPHQDASAAVLASMGMPEFAISVDTINTPGCAKPLARPVIVTAAGSTFIGLNWSDVGADGYRMRRGDELCANFAQVVDTDDLAADDEGRTNGETYCYGVDPYWDNYFGERMVVVGDEATATPEITLQPNPNAFGDGELNIAGVLLDKASFGGGAAYADERAYVGDPGSGTIYAYNRDGAYVDEFLAGGELQPNASNVVAFDGENYVISIGNIGGSDQLCKWDVATLSPVAAFDGDGCVAVANVDMFAVKVLSSGNYGVVGTDNSGADANGFMRIYDSDDGTLRGVAGWDTGNSDYLFDFVAIGDGWVAVGYNDDGFAQQAYAVKFGYNDAMALEFKMDYDIAGAGGQATRVDRHANGDLIALVDNQNLAHFDDSLGPEPTVVALTTGVGLAPAAYDVYVDAQDRLVAAGAVEFGADVRADMWLMEWTGVTYSIDTEAMTIEAGDSVYLGISPTRLESIVASGWKVTANETYAVEY